MTGDVVDSASSLSERFVVARSMGVEVNAWSTLVRGGVVSTAYRKSSALADSPPWYFETLVFLDDVRGIAWQSATTDECEARRQHGLVVRWFSRMAS